MRAYIHARACDPKEQLRYGNQDVSASVLNSWFPQLPLSTHKKRGNSRSVCVCVYMD